MCDFKLQMILDRISPFSFKIKINFVHNCHLEKKPCYRDLVLSWVEKLNGQKLNWNDMFFYVLHLGTKAGHRHMVFTGCFTGTEECYIKIFLHSEVK